MKMPHGPYNGCELRDVPTDHLRALAAESWLMNPLRRAVEAELRLRAECEALRQAARSGRLAVRPGDAGLLRRVLDEGSRAVRRGAGPGTVQQIDHMLARLNVQLDQAEVGDHADTA